MKYKIYLIKKKWLKFRYSVYSTFFNNNIAWLKKHKIFMSIGDNCFFQPKRLPNETKLIKLHNNIKVATNVTFFTHDVINAVYADIDLVPYQTHAGCIEIFDNVFIGGNAILVGPLKIGPNAIIAAGSVVTKNVLEGEIVGGNPAKKIGTFSELKMSKMKADKNKCYFDPEENARLSQLWKEFD